MLRERAAPALARRMRSIQLAGEIYGENFFRLLAARQILSGSFAHDDDGRCEYTVFHLL
jgi:hypothetical protein